MAPTTKKTKTASAQELTARVVDVKGADKGTTLLPSSLFGVMASLALIAQYVRVYLSNQRQGTHKAKDRGEVVGSTRKIYRQKGTGRARHGDNRAPIFVGGGVSHGPVVRTHALSINKKQRQKALFGGLSLKVRDNNMLVLEGVSTLTGKTKEMNGVIKALDVNIKKTLFVYAPDQAEMFRKLMGNIQGVRSSQDRLVNAYDVLRADVVVFTKEALDDFVTFRKAA